MFINLLEHPFFFGEKNQRIIQARPTGWILELDITAYFDSTVREQLMELIEKRVSDSSVLRRTRKWIQVGVIDQEQLLVSDKGTGQGQTISPLLANIYLHYVFDEWFKEMVKPRLRGEAHEIPNCCRGMRLCLAAFASTKLPSTDKFSPCTNPTATHWRTMCSNNSSNSFDS